MARTRENPDTRLTFAAIQAETERQYPNGTIAAREEEPGVLVFRFGFGRYPPIGTVRLVGRQVILAAHGEEAHGWPYVYQDAAAAAAAIPKIWADRFRHVTDDEVRSKKPLGHTVHYSGGGALTHAALRRNPSDRPKRRNPDPDMTRPGIHVLSTSGDPRYPDEPITHNLFDFEQSSISHVHWPDGRLKDSRVTSRQDWQTNAQYANSYNRRGERLVYLVRSRGAAPEELTEAQLVEISRTGKLPDAVAAKSNPLKRPATLEDAEQLIATVDEKAVIRALVRLEPQRASDAWALLAYGNDWKRMERDKKRNSEGTWAAITQPSLQRLARAIICAWLVDQIAPDRVTLEQAFRAAAGFDLHENSVAMFRLKRLVNCVAADAVHTIEYQGYVKDNPKAPAITPFSVRELAHRLRKPRGSFLKLVKHISSLLTQEDLDDLPGFRQPDVLARAVMWALVFGMPREGATRQAFGRALAKRNEMGNRCQARGPDASEGWVRVSNAVTQAAKELLPEDV